MPSPSLAHNVPVKAAPFIVTPVIFLPTPFCNQFISTLHPQVVAASCLILTVGDDNRIPKGLDGLLLRDAR